VKAGLTDDVEILSENVKSIAEWSKPLLPYVDSSNKVLYDQLGLFQHSPLPEKQLHIAKILQHLLEKNWKMKDTDRDMILMLHEFEYVLDNQKHFLRSSLVVKGENALRTAMAKTVGLPLGIAARLILEDKLKLSGLHIPLYPKSMSLSWPVWHWKAYTFTRNLINLQVLGVECLYCISRKIRMYNPRRK
jgi:saccharopine dehydrogenase-like NADP-dependent oxidoreductase